MKILCCIIAMFVVAILIVPGCKKEKESETSTDNPVCKSNLKTTIGIEEIADSLSCVDFDYDASAKMLSLNHINTAFNCCVESIGAQTSIHGNQIIIQEYEVNPQCNCECLYDLDIVINNVAPSVYQLQLNEPNAGAQQAILFDVNLESDTSGTFCVTRLQYPWGLGF
ncbi:MAG: hypothetical protein KDC05_15595 [Bacteroidales bacterium]|nr:hypothetical protein [Bacteroidales bacterium]